MPAKSGIDPHTRPVARVSPRLASQSTVFSRPISTATTSPFFNRIAAVKPLFFWLMSQIDPGCVKTPPHDMIVTRFSGGGRDEALRRGGGPRAVDVVS